MRSFLSTLSLLFIIVLLSSCKLTRATNMETKNNAPIAKSIDVQGHRGCRGLLPENTLPAFMKALELGVTTLELDLVISKDKQVIISHEPFFNHEISSVDGVRLEKDSEKNHNIYQLTRDELRRYDVGLVPHSRFPQQLNIPAQKPTLIELAQAVHQYCAEHNHPLPYYNVEIKRVPSQDNLYHPSADEFAELVLAAIHKGNIEGKTYIQSFDPASLEAVRQKDKTIPLVFLIYNEDSSEVNLKRLSFTPEVYSPYYELVDEKMVELCADLGMKLIPWTVNEREDMVSLLDLGVDGIISDYPDILLEVVREKEGVEVMR